MLVLLARLPLGEDHMVADSVQLILCMLVLLNGAKIIDLLMCCLEDIKAVIVSANAGV
jgi:hypothetical protein